MLDIEHRGVRNGTRPTDRLASGRFVQSVKQFLNLQPCAQIRIVPHVSTIQVAFEIASRCDHVKGLPLRPDFCDFENLTAR